MAFRWPSQSRPPKSNSSTRGRGKKFGRKAINAQGRPGGSRSSTAPSLNRSSMSAFSLPRYGRNSTRRQQQQPLSTTPSVQPERNTPLTQDTQNHNDDDEDADSLNEIVMAVDFRERGSVACAYYVAQEEKLYFMEELKFGSVEIVDTLKLFINPTVILVSFRADDQLINLLDPGAAATEVGSLDSTAFDAPYIFETRPQSDFNYETAKNKLFNLGISANRDSRVNFSVPGDAGNEYFAEEHYGWAETTGHAHQNLVLSSWITMESRSTVGCAGAILSYLQRRRASRYLPGDDAARLLFRITVIETFTMQGTMFINADALLSLQIIQPDPHSNPHYQTRNPSSAKPKQCLSVYGLFHHLAKTTQGKFMLRQYFLRPSLSLELVEERLDTISVFLRPENSTSFAEIVKCLEKVVNVRNSMINLRRGVSSRMKKSKNVARGIWSGLREARSIETIFQDVAGAERLAIYAKIKAGFDTYGLTQIGHMINQTIDFEELEDQSRMVRSGVDEELDERRRLYEGMSDLLSEVARDIARAIPEGLPLELNVIYFPQIGFLIAMPMESETGRSLWEGSEEDPWKRMFSSETVAYYKNDQMRQMDSHFGDIWSDICDKEIEIVHELAQRVLQYEDALSTASDICGELDCLLALAAGARKHNFHRPRMTTDNVIDIKQGRHPLQELMVPSFVPNDTYIVGHGTPHSEINDPSSPASSTAAFQSVRNNATPSGPSTLLLTGPNYSGKSVYLKQAALIVYLAHVGSFVPAETGTRIGITDKILTRIATHESVSAPASAFAIDLQQICLALDQATPRSLVVIDEFGKGTDAADGAGLFAGVVEHLLGAGGREPPKVLAATHFHEIFEAGFLPPRPGLGFAHMEIRLDEEATAAGDAAGGARGREQVTHLYNYRDGRSVKSYGTCCAAMSGISAEVVRRAEELAELAARGEDLVAACAIMSNEEEVEELKVAERMARDFLGGELDEDPKELLNRIVAVEQSI